MIGKWLFVVEFLAGSVLIMIFLSALGRAELWGVSTDYLVNTVLWNCLMGWWAAYVIIAIIATVETVRWVRRDNLTALRRAMLLVKLTSIPFFVINFIFATLVALGSMLAGTIVVVPVTYLLMVFTSAYGIGCLVVLRRRGAVPRWLFGINLAMHFFFVLDIISTVVVAITTGAVRRPPPAPTGQAPRTL